jgi:hypothetical protein
MIAGHTAVFHFNGRLPLMGDLRELPGPADLNVLATNLRTKDGKRPTFADSSDAWFLIPLREVLVIELPSDVLDLPLDEPATEGRLSARSSAAERPAEPLDPLPDTSPLETDEALLARIRDL